MNLDYYKAAYRRVWESFRHATSTKDGRHDTPYWQAHDVPFAACVVRINAADLQPGLPVFSDVLAPLTGVRLHPDYFLHVMLQEFGFVSDQPRQPDEISNARLEEIILSAVEPVSAMAPFPITLGGANAFEDAVFLEVGGGDSLEHLHARIYELAAMPGVPVYPYLPHCTIAHFDGKCPPDMAAKAIEPWRGETFGRCSVTEIEVVLLDPKRPYPELESYAVIPLGT
jgi:2'-5' RNA ligase